MSPLPRFAVHLVAALGAVGIFAAAATAGATQTRLNRETVASAPANVRPERSIAGTIREVRGDEIIVAGPRGREFRVMPVDGALIRLNGKAARLDSLQPSDKVVILGQVQVRNAGFVAHAITARRK
jgi:hypothetical protein